MNCKFLDELHNLVSIKGQSFDERYTAKGSLVYLSNQPSIMKFRIGPGILVAAAFIGPGTVTICTLAGAKFGYSLLWVLILAVVATVVLQEMAARIGLVTQKGLARVIKDEITVTFFRHVVLALILMAIVLGNTAYEAGNIAGASLGVEAITGTDYKMIVPILIGAIAFLLLFSGSYKVLERFFTGLVLLMSISFLLAAIITRPDLTELGKGLLYAEIPPESIFIILAVVGTTIVPYNLFLHASLVNEKWSGAEHIGNMRRDTLVSVLLGGLVSMAVVVAAAAIPGSEVNSGADLAKGLAPLYGQAARYGMGIGLFAAGITSAITAPLAAAIVANSCFGWQAGMKDWRFRLVWIVVLVSGVVSLTTGFSPIEVIAFAQASNGLVLPLIAIILLLLVNRKKMMRGFGNSAVHNILASFIVILIIILGAKAIYQVLGIS